jgi:hypothetical protein
MLGQRALEFPRACGTRRITMETVSLEYLLALHKYYDLACKNPCPDEDVHELRRIRTLIAKAIEARP